MDVWCFTAVFHGIDSESSNWNPACINGWPSGLAAYNHITCGPPPRGDICGPPPRGDLEKTPQFLPRNFVGFEASDMDEENPGPKNPDSTIEGSNFILRLEIEM